MKAQSETIGTCEICGATDHHLIAGVCPICSPKCKTIDSSNVIDPECVPVILPDEEIEYWGRFYEENNFHSRGIRFEIFMTDPFAISQAILFGTPMPLPRGEDYYPLLPRQRDVALRAHPRVRAISRPLADAELPVFLRRQAD